MGCSCLFWNEQSTPYPATLQNIIIPPTGYGMAVLRNNVFLVIVWYYLGRVFFNPQKQGDNNMNKRHYLVAALAFLILLLPVLTTAEEKEKEKTPAKEPDIFAEKAEEKVEKDAWADSRLGRTTLGEVWSGPPLELEDLRGQVVLMEFWGYRCPPCIASIPHLAKLHKKYSKRGLVVIGTHAQGPKKFEALSVAIPNIPKGANYCIMSRARVPKANFRGIPHVFVFNHQGRVIYEGSPDNKMDKAIVAALKARPNPLLGDMKYKELSAVASKVKSGKLGNAYKKCKKDKDADGRLGKEAAQLFANLDRYARRLEQKAGNENDSPIAAVEALKKLKKSFAGTEYGENAAAKLKGLFKDKEFQTALKADKQYQAIVKASWSVAPQPADKSQQGKWSRKFGKKFKSIKARVQVLKKKYPDTVAAQKAETLLNDLSGQ
jgi:thiol-disulfide isomerase/thioredoxin